MRIIQSESPRPLNLLAMASSGVVAAACGTFGTRGDVEVWDAGRGHRVFLHEVSELNATGTIALTPDGRYLFAGGVQLRLAVIDTHLCTVVARAPTALLRPHLALAVDGTCAVVTSQVNQSGAAECLAIERDFTFRRLWQEGPHEFLQFGSAAITPDRRRAAVVRSTAGPGGRPSQRIEIRNAVSGKLTATTSTDAACPIRQLAFTADGAKLLARTDSRTVQMFDAITGAITGELVHPGRPYVMGIAVHPRGIVACARTSGTVTFWDAEKCEQLRTFDWKAGKLVSVAFAPDGALAAAGTEDGKVVVWDVDV